MSKEIIWIAEDDASMRFIIEQHLSKEGFLVKSFDLTNDLLKSLKKTRRPPQLIVSDIRIETSDSSIEPIDGLSLIDKVHEIDSSLPIVIITAFNDLDTTVEAYKKGAFEFLAKPFDLSELLDIIKKALASNNQSQLSESDTVITDNKIIGDSPAIQQIYQVIGKLTKSHMNALIYGESGTGKELIAKALHSNSPRREGRFIAINTASIPEDLLAVELFGHEKGAFTGALNQESGYFEQASNGTLFLDEVGDMPISLQTRLLRVLQDGLFYRVGGRKLIKTNTRIIAATNKNLLEMVENGQFREDLYHRLNVMYIEIPPLRKRLQDIKKLCDYFLKQSAEELNTSLKMFSEEAMLLLNNYRWPGNVRQLENLCKRLCALIASDTIHKEDLPEEVKSAPIHGSTHSTTWIELFHQEVNANLKSNQSQILKHFTELTEKMVIQQTLEHFNNNKFQTAKKLGIGRTTLDRKIAELNISLASAIIKT